MRASLVGLVGGLALAVLTPGPLHADGVPGTPVRDAAVDTDALRERISAILEREQVAGAGIAMVSRSGLVWAGGIGLADVAQQRAASADTPFRLGSITKNVTALAVMQQVELGRLSLDSRLLAIAPEVPFDNPWETSHPVTMANLLEHTAGFDMVRFNDDMDFGPTPRLLLDALEVNPEARHSRWAPGTRMAYSNEGFTAAGYVIEKLTGRSFDDVVHESVFAPLGMRQSALRLVPAHEDTLAQGYGPGGHPEAYVEDMQRPAANLIASANDMARYLQLWLGRGEVDGRKILSADGIARMELRTTLPYAGPEAQYGLGTDTAQYDGFVAHGHTGTTTGFSASFRYFPREGVGWVVMLNALPSGNAIPDVEAEVLKFLVQEQTAAVSAGVSPPDLGRFVGYYRDAAPTQDISAPLIGMFGGTDIQLRSDGLWERTRTVSGLRSLISRGPWQRLVATDDEGSFRHADEAIATRYFTRSEMGVPVLVTPMGYFEQRPGWIADLQSGLLLGSLACLLSAFVLVGISIMHAFRATSLGPLGGLPPTLPQLPPILLALVVAVTWLVLSRSPERLAEVNATTLGVFLASSVVPAIAIISIATAVRAAFDADIGVVFRAYLLLLATGGGVLSVFAWSAHWVALRTWAW